MKDTIIALTISLIASFVYDWLKNAFRKNSDSNSVSGTKYSKKYISAVKKEFYIGFFAGIALSIIPETRFETINLAINIFSYFMFFIALIGFQCAIEIVNHFTDDNSDNNAG